MSENLNLKTIQTIDPSPFKHLCVTIGELPSTFLESMSYYELLAWFVNYLENTVIPAVNANGEATAELQELFIELKTFVDEYFDNLDVQEEINNKLDEMADDGSLYSLIGAYIDPIQQEFENEITAIVNSQNAEIANIDNKIQQAITGNPLPATTVDDMTDTDRIYVLVSTGEWYYYDGEEWTSGGSYQSPVANYDTTLTAKNGVADSKSIGDRINSQFYVNNLIDISDIQENKRYLDDGTIANGTGYNICNKVIPIKNGDTIHSCLITDTTITAKPLGQVVKVDCYGNFIEVIGNYSNVGRYTSDFDGFIKVAFILGEEETSSQRFFFMNIPDKNYMSIAYQSTLSDEIKQINNDINNNSVYYNHLDTSKCILNQNLNPYGDIVYSSAGYFITHAIPVKNGDVVRFYNYNTTGTYNMSQIARYNTSKQFIERVAVTGNTYTAPADGYIVANCTKPTSVTTLQNLDITINREIAKHYPYGRIIGQIEDKPVKISKVNSTNYLINFGDYNVTLFKTENASTNANNWNLKLIKRGDNTLVPEGTDFIGPVRINQNADYIGGVHGDETTTHIIICTDGTSYKDDDIADINTIECNKLTLTLISDVYDQALGDQAFTRNVVINITANKIHCSNTFVASKALTLKTSCTGGLIACQNPIINNIMVNNKYYDSAPTTSTIEDTRSKNCNYAVIDTIYGTIIANNIKGHENPNYKGFMTVYTNESPMRCKVYFEPYYNGSYALSAGDIVTGEFEYIFN